MDEKIQAGVIVWHKVTKKKFVVEGLKKNAEGINVIAICGTESGGKRVTDEFPLTSLTTEKPQTVFILA